MRKYGGLIENILYDEDYSVSSEGEYVTDAFDVDEPICPRCGSYEWEFCRLGENSQIAFCSECPEEKKRTH